MITSTARFLRLTLALSLVAVVSAGCSKQADTKEQHLTRANEAFAAEQYVKAEKEYRDVLRLQADDPVAQRQLGIIYFDQAQLRQAYPFLKKTSELEPDNLDVQLKLALSHFSVRDYQNARELARQILEKKPGQQEALMLMVDTAATPDDIQETRALIEKLKAREDDRLAYHLARGAMELRDKNDATAETEFKAALSVDPKSSAVYSALGNLYLNRQDLAAAGQAIERAAALSPLRSPKRLRNVDFKLRNGAPAEAKKLVEAMVRDAPDYLPPRVYLMRIVCSEKRGDDCAAQVDKILAQDPINYDALFESGLASLSKGEATRAIRIFEQLSSMNAQDPRVRYQLALAYLASTKDASPVTSQNAMDAAENNLSAAVKLDPKFQQAVLLLAELKIKKGAPAAAADLLIPFVKEQPQLAQAQYLLGSAYLALQKPAEALAVYRRMVEAFPQDPQPSFLMGRILSAQRRSSDARKALEKALEISPTYILATELLVDLDLSDKQYARALDRVQPLIDKDSKAAQALAIRGKIYLAQSDFARAEPDLLKAIELDPELEPAYLLLGQTYVASNRSQQAIEKLNSLVGKKPSAPALMQLAEIHQRLKQFGEARDAYEKLLKISPNFGPALNNLAVLYSDNLGQLDTAAEMARKAKEAMPNEPHLADTLGWILFKKGDYRNALRTLQEAASKLNNPEIDYHVGMAHYMLGEDAPARTALQKAADASAEFPGKEDARSRLAVLAIDAKTADSSAATKLENYLRATPNDPAALFRLGTVQEKGGRVDDAIKTYQKIITDNPMFGPATRQLALLYGERSSDDPKAYEVATKARETYPNDPDVAKTLGILNYRRGVIAQSIELLKEAAAKRKDDPEILYYLGEIYRQQKQWGECKDTLQRALSLNLPSALTDGAKRALAECAETSPL